MPNKTSEAVSKLQSSSLTKASIAIITALAMLAYSAFPLAAFLNRPYFWHGLVSGLTEPGQPHSMFFTAIDITASLFGILFFSYLAWRQREDRMQAAALGLVVIACVAELITDIYALPAGFPTNSGIPSAHYFRSHPSFDAHLAASFVNSTAFLISFGLWTLHRRHTSAESRLRELVFVAAVCLSMVGTVVGHIHPAASPTLQRIFILCYCYWFITLPYDSLEIRRHRGRH